MKTGNALSAILFAVVPALILIFGIWSLDKKEREPWRFLAFAIGLGAVVAPAIAYGLEKLFSIPTSISGQILPPSTLVLSPWTPVVEELVRAAAIFVVILAVYREVDDLLDGIIYGACVGAGFFLTTAFFSILSTEAFGSATATGTLFANAVAGINHVFYGAVIGLFIALAARRNNVGGMVGGALFGAGVAMGFHLLHDYLPTAVASPDTAAPGAFVDLLQNLPNALGLIALSGIVIWALGREGVIIGEELRDEVGNGTVTRDEYVALTRPGRRFGSRSSAMFKGGSRFRLQSKLYSLETDLAFRKYHARSEGARLRHYRDEDAYRQEIRDVRGQLQGSGVSQ
jgi:RsiW-degrading membrane proteinase PrsW (M82 family)